jgi:hypothetical protein
MANSHRLNIGWNDDETDLQQKLLEVLEQDVMLYEVPNRPGEYTFEVVTDRSCSDLTEKLETVGIEVFKCR